MYIGYMFCVEEIMHQQNDSRTFKTLKRAVEIVTKTQMISDACIMKTIKLKSGDAVFINLQALKHLSTCHCILLGKVVPFTPLRKGSA